GRCDILVNNAGLNIAERKWSELTPAGAEMVIDGNLSSAFYCSTAALPMMRKRKDGVLIHTSSMAGRNPSTLSGAAYSAAKHGVVAMSHTINMEECVNGIRSCVVCPGEVATPIHDSHGVVRVPRYATQKKAGTVVADVTVDVLVDTPVIAVVDGKYGFGQTVTPQAVRIGIDKCRKNGLSAVTLRNAGHVGRVGDWAEMAAEAGLVSIHFVNASGSVLVAPYGGVQRRFSTAPYCVGVPRPGQDPLV